MTPLPAFPRLSPNCERRRRALAPLARDILRGRGAGRPLAPAAWIAIFSLVYLFAQASQLGWFLAPSLALAAGLSLIALFDARYFVIPDGPVWFLFFSGAATALVGAPQEAPARIAAAAAGYAALRLVAFAYEAWRGFPGVGQGDAKLFAVAGLWLGFRGLPSCLLYAVISALAAAVAALRAGTLASAREPIPFGPHLALGLWLVWTLGPIEAG